MQSMFMAFDKYALLIFSAIFRNSFCEHMLRCLCSDFFCSFFIHSLQRCLYSSTIWRFTAVYFSTQFSWYYSRSLCCSTVLHSSIYIFFYSSYILILFAMFIYLFLSFYRLVLFIASHSIEYFVFLPPLPIY